MKKKFLITSIIISLLFLISSSCIRERNDLSKTNEEIIPPEETSQSEIENSTINTPLLDEMIASLVEENPGIDSISIVYQDNIILNTAFPPYSLDQTHIIHSCTKSILSILIGIAIDQGYIENLDQPVTAFFPDKTILNNSPEKGSITLEHLLTMSSGLDCRDSYLYTWEGLREM
ncbi:MAG: serine hydrolase, partial [Anaerolineaceae bacterium]|nr:serine hydrolase [Anaerolineaceae bacterium]